MHLELPGRCGVWLVPADNISNGEFKQTHWLIKFIQTIDVTVGSCLTTRKRTKNSQRFDSELFNSSLVSHEDL